MVNKQKKANTYTRIKEETGYRAIVDAMNFIITGAELIQCTNEWKQNNYFSPNSCIGFVLSGEGWIKQNETYVEPQVGQMYLLTEKHAHSFGVRNNQPYKMYYCNFYDTSEIVDFFSLYDLPLCITHPDPHYIQSLFDKVVQDKSEAGLIGLIEKKVALYTLITEYIKVATAHQSSDESDCPSVVMWEPVQYIHTHYKEKISNDELAKLVGYNREYFIRRFTQVMKCSPIKYLNSIRIKEAEKLLRKTSMSINGISGEVGFDTQHYFTYVFKKERGMTPGEYRKMYRVI